jgi:RNA polymerase sigma-70 factor (ECF subfamily)
MLDEVLNSDLQRRARLTAIELAKGVTASDIELVQAVLDGDESAFAEIFERHKLLVTRVVGRFFRERGDIEESVQQAFTKAYFSLAKFRGGEDNSFPAWITRIAVNICYDEFRRRQRKPESLFTEMSEKENDYIEAIADGREISTERSLVAAQLVEKITSGLDAKDRIAMTLVYCEDYSLDEVATAIGITRSNLKSRLFRCRTQIKKRFGHLFEY